MFKNLTTNLLLSLMFMASTVSAMNEKYADAPKTKTVIVRQLDPLALKKKIPAHLLPAIFSYIIDIQDDEGNTLAHHAVRKSSMAAINLCLQAKANFLTKRNYRNKTPLDNVRDNAESNSTHPTSRNEFYNVWKILDNVGIKTFIPYTTKPTLAELIKQFEEYEWETAKPWYIRDAEMAEKINNECKNRQMYYFITNKVRQCSKK